MLSGIYKSGSPLREESRPEAGQSHGTAERKSPSPFFSPRIIKGDVRPIHSGVKNSATNFLGKLGLEKMAQRFGSGSGSGSKEKSPNYYQNIMMQTDANKSKRKNFLMVNGRPNSLNCPDRPTTQFYPGSPNLKKPMTPYSEHAWSPSANSVNASPVIKQHASGMSPQPFKEMINRENESNRQTRKTSVLNSVLASQALGEEWLSTTEQEVKLKSIFESSLDRTNVTQIVQQRLERNRHQLLIEEDNESYIRRVKQMLKNKTPANLGANSKLSRGNSPASQEKVMSVKSHMNNTLAERTLKNIAANRSSSGSNSKSRNYEADREAEIKIQFGRYFTLNRSSPRPKYTDSSEYLPEDNAQNSGGKQQRTVDRSKTAKSSGTQDVNGLYRSRIRLFIDTLQNKENYKCLPEGRSTNNGQPPAPTKPKQSVITPKQPKRQGEPVSAKITYTPNIVTQKKSAKGHSGLASGQNAIYDLLSSFTEQKHQTINFGNKSKKPSIDHRRVPKHQSAGRAAVPEVGTVDSYLQLAKPAIKEKIIMKGHRQHASRPSDLNKIPSMESVSKSNRASVHPRESLDIGLLHHDTSREITSQDEVEADCFYQIASTAEVPTDHQMSHFRKVSEVIANIVSKFRSKKDVYDDIREYVDLCQMPTFNSFEVVYDLISAHFWQCKCKDYCFESSEVREMGSFMSLQFHHMQREI